MFSSNQFKRIKDQGNVLFNSPYLQNLSKVERYEFIQLCHRRKYNEGEYIYYQNDPGTGIYFIEDGSVRLITKAELDKEEQSHILQAADSFGILSIGYEFRRFATARCNENCVLLGFFKPDFETLKKRHPRIAVKFMETLAMVTMRQLSMTIDELKQITEIKRVIALQLEAFYNNPVNP